MKTNFGKVLVIFVLLAAIAGVLALKSRQPSTSMPPAPQETAVPVLQDTPGTPVTVAPNTATPQREPARPTVQEMKTKPAPASVARPPKPNNTVTPAVSPPKVQPAPAKAQTLPRLLELGADSCIPCKMMQPVLAELRQEYAGKLQVDFIDVWKDPSAGKPYNIQAIPVQIFFDANGKEIFRHLGFYPKEEILATFKAQGISL